MSLKTMTTRFIRNPKDVLVDHRRPINLRCIFKKGQELKQRQKEFQHCTAFVHQRLLLSSNIIRPDFDPICNEQTRYSSNLTYVNATHRSQTAQGVDAAVDKSANLGTPKMKELQTSVRSDEAVPARSLKDVSFVDKNEQTHLLKTKINHQHGTGIDNMSALSSRRIDPSMVKQVYYFDTLAFVKKLEASGFTREQAEGCAECLVELINTTLDHQGRYMVSKPQQEIAVQQLMSEIVSVKKDMTLLQKSEFSSLKTDTEKITIALNQIQDHINDEIVKLKGQFSLDINLERGRSVEAHADNEKRLQQLHNKIDTEVANLKTIYEIYRNDVFKYAGGTVIAVGGLMLGFLRLMA